MVLNSSRSGVSLVCCSAAAILLSSISTTNAFSLALPSTTTTTTTTTSSIRISTRTPSSSRTSTSTSTSLNNFFTDIGDMITGGPLGEETNLPYSPPFCDANSICAEGLPRTYAVKERALSFTGEDFDVYCTGTNEPFVSVRGAMLHLPGKDKMRLKSVHQGCDEEVVVLDRVLMAVTPTYDIFRGGMMAEKVGWIEKKVVSMTDTFDVYMEGKGGFGVTGLFKPPPAYQITGDFIDRNFVMKNAVGQVVAKVAMDGLIQFDQFNHYQVQVAPGMDAMMVLACTCAIDEEFDEEHAAKKRG
eukprot:CAMPEP_0194076226 /NCGR_PEP_ID=MMETSP0149-20130528/3064_1 /TAXON_ID=122233 /ORGANISM="Chaetoceros debilis, Strain MM31A-1" /LENGTH=300 /DNA_ID=CAMNT_0038756915 /DNA_START=37 /DNA_END=939 /DNA_ORIENTATION=-